MLPPYKGRRPDGHTRGLRDHSPVLGSLSLFAACAFCCHRSTWRVQLLPPLFLARAQLVGLEPETFPPSFGHRILTAAEKGLSYVSATTATKRSADAYGLITC